MSIDDILTAWSEAPVTYRVTTPQWEKTLAVRTKLYEMRGLYVNTQELVTCFYRDDADFETLLNNLAAGGYRFQITYGGWSDVWKVSELLFSSELDME